MLSAAGGLTATARNFLFASERCVYHGTGAADPTVNGYGIGGTIELAGATFHAGIILDNLDPTISRREHPVRTHVKACAAVDAEHWTVSQRVDGVPDDVVDLALTGRLRCHHIAPYHFATLNPISRLSPMMNVAAISGT
jgi:hypothetical protein